MREPKYAEKEQNNLTVLPKAILLNSQDFVLFFFFFEWINSQDFESEFLDDILKVPACLNGYQACSLKECK